MIRSQAYLDTCLDRTHTVHVEISHAGPLSQRNQAYDAIRNLTETGFSFTARELLHAIGCKTAAIPVSAQDDERYYRLKHYCRVLQFIGLPSSAYCLNVYALDHLDKKRAVYRTILDEKRDRRFLESITVAGDEFLGRWFDSWLPKRSTRYKRLYQKQKDLRAPFLSKKRSVFQGLRRDFYESGFTTEPFSKPLLEKRTIHKYRRFDEAGVSVFPDGTVMVFRQI